MSDDVHSPRTLYLVKQLESAIRAIMDDGLRSFGLTTLQYTALSVLQQRDDLSSAQLARRAFVRPQTMHQMVQSLHERELIERRRDPGNRRVLLIRLSTSGRALLDECEPLVRDIEERMLAGMPSHERSAFRYALAQGCDELSDIAHDGWPQQE